MRYEETEQTLTVDITEARVVEQVLTADTTEARRTEQTPTATAVRHA